MLPLRARTASLLALLLASGVLAGACILVDPPAALPAQTPHRPIIVHGSVFPPSTQILTMWPGEFDVPVAALDVTQDVPWEAFIDGALSDFGNLRSDPGSQDGGVREIFARLNQPAKEACHVVEIMVAASFVVEHTPDALGGDSVVWFYSPTGDLTTCPIFDAGPVINDGSFPDANAPPEGGD